MNYYNEWDKGAAAWLRELITAGHLPQGYVDERSITEVTAGDLEGFTQCHFFAGIGGWPLALDMAGVRSDQRLWTGSPPCQPFSVAGKQLGQLDERHLAPTFMRLVGKCRPPVLFGEQVAAAIGKHWLDDLFADLEKQGYACGAAVLPAASVGAPHKRDRLFVGAALLEHTGGIGRDAERDRDNAGYVGEQSFSISQNGSMAHSHHYRQQSGRGKGGCGEPPCARNNAGRGQPISSMADTGDGTGQPCEPRAAVWGLPASAEKDAAIRAVPHNGHWSDADWLSCRDGKIRPVEPGTFPLANGVPARVGRLRGYGNAIVPQVAAEFIRAFMVGVK